MINSSIDAMCGKRNKERERERGERGEGRRSSALPGRWPPPGRASARLGAVTARRGNGPVRHRLGWARARRGKAGQGGVTARRGNGPSRQRNRWSGAVTENPEYNGRVIFWPGSGNFSISEFFFFFD